MSLQYHFVLPPTGPADAGVVAEMFDDVKAYLDSFVPIGGAAPFDARYVTLATNAILTQERVLTGTSNQIIITDNGAGSTVVLSLPQSIANTSSPSFAGILYRNNSGNTVTVNPPSSFSNYTLTLPTDDGAANQVLKTDGSGVLSWVDQTASGANTALSNLASVAINLGLVPGTTNSIDLGSASKLWRDVYVANDLVLQENSGTNVILVKAPTGLASYTLTLPTTGGTSGYVLQTDGSGTTSWVAQTSVSGFATVALDNLSGVAINATLKLATDVAFDLGSSSKYWNHLFLKDATFRSAGSGSNIIVFKAPGTMAADYTFTLPATAGTNNYILKTDGSGNTDWVSAGSLIAGATVALDNLSGVAINASLVVGASHDQTYNLGSTTLAWLNVYARNIEAGRSGVSGLVEIFPSTASKGSLLFQAANNAGSTTTIITNASQASGRTYTIPDAGGSADFVMTAGSQTVAGAKTFSSAIAITATSNHLVLSTSSNTLTISAAAQATSARTWTIPDISGAGTFAALEGTQTFTGTKTFNDLRGTFGADIAAGSHKITGLTNGSSAQDAVAFIQLPIWAKVTQTAGTFALTSNSGIASIAKNSTGKYTLTFTTARSGNDYVVVCSTTNGLVKVTAPSSSSSVQIVTTDFSDNPDDRNGVTFVMIIG